MDARLKWVNRDEEPGYFSIGFHYSIWLNSDPLNFPRLPKWSQNTVSLRLTKYITKNEGSISMF